MIRVAIVGGSGYVGGELLRLLLDHPHVEVVQVTSRQHAGRYVHSRHPNLRGRTRLRFVPPEALEPCDHLFLCLPHGEAARQIDRFASLCTRLVDLSADFRLRNPAAYEAGYGWTHPAPRWLSRFVYGLPELTREQLRGARYASGVGCNATAVILGLLPLARAGLVARAVADLKVGSSEAGATPTPGSHHPERSGALRPYAPAGHRHALEVLQALGPFPLHMTVTAVERVRGVQAAIHVFPTRPLTEREVWDLYRTAYEGEPFVRLVRERRGTYRLPEPRILSGSNYCDVGFVLEEGGERLVVFAALDNLMKGAAGTAVQAMNRMWGWEETTALTFPGLHPC